MNDLKAWKPEYSGDRSHEFWAAINLFYGHHELWQQLYELGCLLQNIESDILVRIRRIANQAMDGDIK